MAKTATLEPLARDCRNDPSQMPVVALNAKFMKIKSAKDPLTDVRTPGISDDEFKMRTVLALEEIARHLKGTAQVAKALNTLNDTLVKVGFALEQHR
jgi:hypothetical protein